MPEGDTIFRAARRLHAALAGKPVVGFDTAYAQIARAAERRPVVGRRVEDVSSVGKHCLVRFTDDLVLRTHCRMHGAWHLYRPGERWQRAPHRMRVRIDVPDFVAVAFDVPVAELRTGAALARDPALAKLGPDLLADGFDPAEAVRRARALGDEAVGVVLLRQTVAAGIGNVYRSEILHLAGLHPATPTSALGDEELASLFAVARRLLRANVAVGAPGEVVFSGGMRRTTGFLDPGARLWVYGRAGEPCRRCEAPVAVAKQGEDARVVFWCPRCQPGPDAAPA